MNRTCGVALHEDRDRGPPDRFKSCRDPELHGFAREQRLEPANDPDEVPLGAHHGRHVLVGGGGLVAEAVDRTVVEPDALHLPLDLADRNGPSRFGPSEQAARAVRAGVESLGAAAALDVEARRAHRARDDPELGP